MVSLVETLEAPPHHYAPFNANSEENIPQEKLITRLARGPHLLARLKHCYLIKPKYVV